MIQGVYVYLAAEISPGSPVLLALRVSLGAAVLLVPTVMMGITLPLMAQALSSQGERIGQSVAMLYASNTAGAAFGAILTSYAIIPLLGTQSTTLLAALINFLVALGALGLGGLRLIFRELRELYQLKRQQDWRSRAEVLLASEQPDGGRLFCQELARASGMANSAALAQWQQACQLHHSAAEQLTLYSHHLLSGQDERARAVILRWSSEAAVLVAISPLAVVDMLLILWRSVKMVDEVARCYGIRLGYWSRIRLFRLIARHMLYAGVSELVTDVGLDWLGAELTARLSTRIAQGLGAGLLTARLGLQTMQLCRPIPFGADEKPGLGQIRRQLLKTLGDKLGAVLTPKSAPQPEAVTIESEK